MAKHTFFLKFNTVVNYSINYKHCFMSASDNKNTKNRNPIMYFFFYIKCRIQTLLQRSKIWVDRKTTKFLKLVLLSRFIFLEKLFVFAKIWKIIHVFMIMSHPNVLRNISISIVNTDAQWYLFCQFIIFNQYYTEKWKTSKITFLSDTRLQKIKHWFFSEWVIFFLSVFSVPVTLTLMYLLVK